MQTVSIPHSMVLNEPTDFMPGISIDCVVFGFNENQLKVLLLSLPHQIEMALPGGYVKKDETLEQAAERVLEERTGLRNVFLQQFHSFSKTDRVSSKFPSQSLKELGFTDSMLQWLSNRFITVGFYALVNYADVVPTPDHFSQSCGWQDIENDLLLMMDHKEILTTALETLRLHLNHKPIGLNLLSEKFTMPELQKLYETILGKKLDRRNFQRKIESYRILNNLKERKSGVAHKAPYLYSFNSENYNRALTEGLHGGW